MDVDETSMPISAGGDSAPDSEESSPSVQVRLTLMLYVYMLTASTYSSWRRPERPVHIEPHHPLSFAVQFTHSAGHSHHCTQWFSFRATNCLRNWWIGWRHWRYQRSFKSVSMMRCRWLICCWEIWGRWESSWIRRTISYILQWLSLQMCERRLQNHSSICFNTCPYEIRWWFVVPLIDSWVKTTPEFPAHVPYAFQLYRIHYGSYTSLSVISCLHM